MAGLRRDSTPQTLACLDWEWPMVRWLSKRQLGFPAQITIFSVCRTFELSSINWGEVVEDRLDSLDCFACFRRFGRAAKAEELEG